MANITVFDPDSGNTKQISMTIEASMIIQNMLAETEFFVLLATSAADVSGNAIPKFSIKSLSEGAGGTGLDRYGDALPNDGKYVNLTAAIDDYVARMVEGVDGEPWTEMAFV